MNPDDQLTARLLAGRDQLTRSEKDAILESVLPAPARRARWAGLAVPALAAAAALFVIAPWRAAPSDDFTARGGSGAVANLRVACPGVCEQGSKLVFDAHGTTGYRYFAASAKGRDGTVAWYFPDGDRETGVDLATLPATGVVARVVVIGSEHARGIYTVYGVFSAQPLTRPAIRAAYDPDRLTAGEGTKGETTELVIR